MYNVTPTPIEGIYNFRDVGGWPTDHGYRLRSGILFRSGQPSHATPTDIATLRRISVATVIDMRGKSERERFPSALTDREEIEILCYFGETRNRPPNLNVSLSDITPAETIAKEARDVSRDGS